MNLQDRFMEWLLGWFDRAMDKVSGGEWSKQHGEARWEYKINRSK